MKVKGRIKAKPDLPVARKASEAHWGSFDGVQTDWWAEVWCLDCSPHRFDEDQDESMDVLWARSDAGVFAIHGSSCRMMESARQQLQGQAVICGRLVQRSRARSTDQMALTQLPFVDHSRSQWSQWSQSSSALRVQRHTHSASDIWDLCDL